MIDEDALRNMLDELCVLIRARKLSAPACTEVCLQDFRKALENAMKPYVSTKQVFVMWPHLCVFHMRLLRSASSNHDSFISCFGFDFECVDIYCILGIYEHHKDCQSFRRQSTFIMTPYRYPDNVQRVWVWLAAKKDWAVVSSQVSWQIIVALSHGVKHKNLHMENMLKTDIHVSYITL